MNKVKISLFGCDDTTRVTVQVSDRDVLFLETLAKVVSAEGGGCMPTMRVEVEDE